MMSVFSEIFELISEKLRLEHHDYLEQYVDMLSEGRLGFVDNPRDRMQLLSNSARIISNF